MTNNVELGLVLKAMYKLSGMTVGALSEKSGITVDTLNNLFYGRVQKPGFFGVVTLVETMGYRVEDLLKILREYDVKELPQNTLTEILTSLDRQTQEDANMPMARPAVSPKKETPISLESLEAQRRELNEEHERQLDRFKATHAKHSEEMKQQYHESLELIRAGHAETVAKLETELNDVKQNSTREIQRLQKRNARLVWALIAETALMVGTFMADLLNHQIGWFRK